MERKKRAYTTPEIKVCPMENDRLLQAASGNAGTIGYGGSKGDAKKWWGEEWEDEEAFSTSSQGEESSYPSYNNVWGEE